MKSKKKFKVKWKNMSIFIIIIISFITLIISSINIVIWLIDSSNTKNEVKNIEEITEVKEVQDNKNTEIIEQPAPPKEDPYWDYIKMNLINVDFEELKKKNPDTKGWIQVSGTNINYPFVQSQDNEYYLDHSFNKNKNKAGWIFLDYRNTVNQSDKNMILYGHSRQDTTMFGSLKNILKNGWLDYAENHVIRLSTETENTLWQVFSVYHIPTTSDYLEINFPTDQTFLNFANKLIDRSAYNFYTSVNKDDQILTLSTCYNNDTERVVLHAKLIKKETR